MELSLGRVPFKEAIDFFQAKQPLPSGAYTDLVHSMHDRAFVIAGVTRQDVLTDVQALVQKALKDGVPLKEFQKSFAQAIEGKWVPTNKAGAENTAWRSRVIYETNIRTAYASGRYQQLQSLKKTHPYWKYRHGDSKRPRPQHLAWDGLMLKADDPWWQTHYPPNGWGCRCFVDACDKVDLEDSGRQAPDQAPPDAMRKVKFGDREIEVPAGVDPGWGYAPGENWHKWPAAAPGGQPTIGKKTIWKPVSSRDAQSWEALGRPKLLASEAVKGCILEDAASGVEAIRSALGADQKMFVIPAGEWQIPLVVDAENLGGHLSPDKVPFVGLLPDLLESPQEVWAQFQEDDRGRVKLRWRMVRVVEVRGKHLALVAEGDNKGILQGWTFMAMSNPKDLNKVRMGRLIFAR